MGGEAYLLDMDEVPAIINREGGFETRGHHCRRHIVHMFVPLRPQCRTVATSISHCHCREHCRECAVMAADGDTVCFWEIVEDHTRRQDSQENSTYYSFSVRSTRTGKEAYSFSGQDVCTAWGEVEQGVYRVTLVPVPEDERRDPDGDPGLHGWKLKVDDFDRGTRFHPLPPKRA